jgi:hypothetical protein
VRARGEKEIYELFPNGDTGEKRTLGMGQGYDPDAVYEINQKDKGSYKTIK